MAINRPRAPDVSLHHGQFHLGWDNSTPPQAEVIPGQAFELELRDCFDGQLPVDAAPADVEALDLSRANPLTGPVRVHGVEVGTSIGIEVVEVEPAEVGWTTIIPGFGLLADEFGEPHVVTTRRHGDRLSFGAIAELPAGPFIGTLGVMPGESGVHSVIPPRRVGGNLDCRELRRGAILWLPVEQHGGLISAGDAHMSQGDGEVCGTAIETAARVVLRVTQHHGPALDGPQLELAPEATPRDRAAAGSRHRRMTMGVGPSLFEGARDATRAMIDLLGRETGLDPADGYALCSVSADLRIIEVVDAPNWVVGLEMDLGVIDAG